MDNMPDLYKLAIVAAQHQHMTVIEYLQRVNESASAFVASDEICDRAELKAAMTQAMCSQGQLTLVLGGKSVGKSRVKEFIAREIERSSGSKLTVVDINMRTVPSKPLYNALLERMAEVSPLSIIKVLGNVVAGGTALQLLDEKTTAAVALYATKTASEITQKALDLVSVLPEYKQFEAVLAKVLQETRSAGNRTLFVVDEANLALPDKMDPAAALAFIVLLTKETRQATVMLLTSQYSYPYRLESAGLRLVDIDKIIFADEVPKEDMLQLLTERWGMSPELAAGFEIIFGGHILFAYRAISGMLDKQDSFDPFTVLDCPGLPKCIKDASARPHMINIARQGFSPVLDIEEDNGAKLIANRSVGGIVYKGAQTFGMPADMWNGGDHEYVIVPAHHLMRMKIRKLLLKAGHIGTQRRWWRWWWWW